MTVIVLAAGQGTRLGNLTKDKPKCMVNINGKSILEYQLDLFSKYFFNNILVVAGYKEEKIDFQNITKVINHNYNNTNMVASLFTAKKYFSDDLVISYGDIIYSKHVLDKLVKSENEFSVIVDLDWRELWDIRMENPIDDIESLRIHDNKIIDLGKKVKNLNDVQGQYIGLIKIKKSFLNKLNIFYDSLDKSGIYDNNNFNNMYMTTFIQLIINKYNNVTPIYINGEWLEIDTVHDIDSYIKSNYLKQITH